MPRVFIVFSLLLLFFVPSVQAAQMIEQYTEKPLPTVPLLKPEELEKATDLYDETPYGDKLLAYQVRLPKNWIKAAEQNVIGAVVVPNFLREVVRFDGPAIKGERGRFIVRAEQLTEQYSALQWFLQYAHMNAYTIQGLNIENDSKLEALYMVVEDGVSYIIRSVVQINGDRAVFAEHYLPASRWGQGQAVQNSAIKSFQLKNLEKVIVESFESYSFLDLMQFSYPASWQLNSFPSRAADRFHAEIINVRDESTLKGRIEVRMMSAETAKPLPEEIDDYKWGIMSKGLVLGDVIESMDDISYAPNINLGAVEIYELESRNDRAITYELAFAIMAGQGQYYFVTMITPGREDDFFLWSKNMEIFKRVTESVTPF